MLHFETSVLANMLFVGFRSSHSWMMYLPVSDKATD